MKTGLTLLAAAILPATILAGFGVKKGQGGPVTTASITHATSTCINAGGGADELCVTPGAIALTAFPTLTGGVSRTSWIQPTLRGNVGSLFATGVNGCAGYTFDNAAQDIDYYSFVVPVDIDPAATSLTLGLTTHYDTVGTGTDVVMDILFSELIDSANPGLEFRNATLAVDVPATIAVNDVANLGVGITGLTSNMAGRRYGFYVSRVGANAGDTYVGSIRVCNVTIYYSQTIL